MTPHEKDLARSKQYADWLAALKVGDRVCYRQNSGWSSASYEILVIERLTATQAACSRGVRFRLKDGHVVGVDYRSVEPITDEVLNTNRAAKLKQWFSTLKSQRPDPSIPVLQAMKDAFDAASKAEEGKTP